MSPETPIAGAGTGQTNDERIQRDVLAELKWDGRATPSEIAVAVRDGIVTLAGVIDSYTNGSRASVLWLMRSRCGSMPPRSGSTRT
jgi:hypothetical protein